MTIALAVITDGRRDCLERTIESLEAMTTGIEGPRIIIDDSASPMHQAFLFGRFGDYEIVSHDRRLGFAGAVRSAWYELGRTDADWFVHLEDDFTFNEPIDWTDLAFPLMVDKRLAQMSLKRQAWSPEEVEAGGIVERDPDSFAEVHGGLGTVWTEHLRYWTTNPSIFNRSIVENFEWPEGKFSEGHFSIKLRDAGYRFGIWGGKLDPPKVTHIGEQRRGKGY